jgi:membrane-bound lytic murein transglycosylase B
MTWLTRAIAAVLICFLTPAASAETPADWGQWLSELRAEAASNGIRQDILDQALTGLEPDPEILQRDRKQAEFTMTAPEYLARVVSDAKVTRGKEMAAAHRELLARVSAKYGVQPRFILAIWGVESFYGAYTGKKPVVASLATLAYDRRRSKFFRRQLLASLDMVNRGYIELGNMKGSWAGAMGQPQFIPTSYLAYAVDEDGDGRRDIWASHADIFGSIANYLAEHGWNDNQTWGRAVSVPGSIKSQWDSLSNRNMTEDKGLQEWASLGVRRADGSALPSPNIPTRLVAPDGNNGPYYATYANFRRIMAYNPSYLYALAIGTLSDRIEY